MEHRELQIQELEILLEFQRICQRHGLRYFLTAGTLLGAVRHSGFIPWDDDIDIAMPREDFERLPVVCRTELDLQYFFQDYTTEPNFPYYFAKIRKNGTEVYEAGLDDIEMHKGVYIDIFPLDICPDRAWKAVLFFKGVELLNCALLSKVSKRFLCGYRKWYMRTAYHTLRHLPKGALFALREWLRKAMAVGASGKRLCTVSGRHGYPRETYQVQWFERAQELYFEGRTFPVPGGWDELLCSMYGDYMTIPPEEEQERHFTEREKGKNETSDYLRHL